MFYEKEYISGESTNYMKHELNIRYQNYMNVKSKDANYFVGGIRPHEMGLQVTN